MVEAAVQKNVALETYARFNFSYGAWMTVVQYLQGIQVQNLQALSKYFYSTGIPRVASPVRYFFKNYFYVQGNFIDERG